MPLTTEHILLESWIRVKTPDQHFYTQKNILRNGALQYEGIQNLFLDYFSSLNLQWTHFFISFQIRTD